VSASAFARACSRPAWWGFSIAASAGCSPSAARRSRVEQAPSDDAVHATAKMETRTGFMCWTLTACCGLDRLSREEATAARIGAIEATVTRPCPVTVA